MLWFLFGIIVGFVMMITILVGKKDFVINMVLSKMHEEIIKKGEDYYKDNGEKKDGR